MPTTPTASTNSLTIRINQQARIERIRIKQASSYLFKLAVKDGDTPFDLTGADVLCFLKSRDGEFQTNATGSLVSAAAGTAEILLEPGHTNYAGTIIFDIIIGRDDQELVHAWGEFVAEARAGNGDPIPAPPAVVDWSKYTFLNTATHGPVRAGTGIDSETNPDGSETHSVKYGDEEGTALEGNAQAADVDPAGTAIAAALDGKVSTTGDENIAGIKTFTGASTFMEVLRLSSGTVIGSNVSILANLTIGGIGAAARGRFIINTSGVQIDAFQDGQHLYLRPTLTGHATPGNLILCDQGGEVEFAGLTASRPLALDANKAVVSPSAADFRELVGLEIGEDVQAQSAALQAYADAADAAERRALLELETVGQAEAEAGTATTTRAWTAQRVAQAIAANGGAAAPEATEPEMREGTETDVRLMSPFGVMTAAQVASMDPLVNQIVLSSDGTAQTNVGSGSTLRRNDRLRVDSGTTINSSAFIRGTVGQIPYRADFAKPLLVSGFLSLDDLASATGIFRLSIKGVSDSYEDLVRTGIGIKLVGPQSALNAYLTVHDGTTYAESSVLPIPSADTQIPFAFFSDAQGSASAWINTSFRGPPNLTMTGAPTSSAASLVWALEAGNEGTAERTRVDLFHLKIAVML